MSITSYIVTFIISLALGYIFYPLFFVANTPDLPSHVHQVTVSGKNGKMTLDIDIRDIKREELPSEIKVKGPVKLDGDGGISITLEKGSKAKVTDYQDGILSIKDMSEKFSGVVEYENTDFTAQVAKKRLDKMMGVDPNAAKIAAQKAADERERRRQDRERLRRLDDEEEEEEEMEEVVETEEKGPLTTTLSEEDLFAVMKDSVNKKIVSEFTVDGVKKWEAGESETLSEVEYQVGFATYEKETIFGTQPVVGKALVRNGIVFKWVYAKSGTDIP